MRSSALILAVVALFLGSFTACCSTTRESAEEPLAPLVELGERLAATGHREADTARVARLAWVLGATTPALVPYLEGEP